MYAVQSGPGYISLIPLAPLASFSLTRAITVYVIGLLEIAILRHLYSQPIIYSHLYQTAKFD